MHFSPPEGDIVLVVGFALEMYYDLKSQNSVRFKQKLSPSRYFKNGPGIEERNIRKNNIIQWSLACMRQYEVVYVGQPHQFSGYCEGEGYVWWHTLVM